RHWTDFGSMGTTSKGLLIQSHKFLYVNRFQRKKATRFDSDHPNLALNRRNLTSRIAIRY
ncbi:MAG: hypothetical protein C4548_04150, partial [Desulfobacteraceae bacterium]